MTARDDITYIRKVRPRWYLNPLYSFQGKNRFSIEKNATIRFWFGLTNYCTEACDIFGTSCNYGLACFYVITFFIRYRKLIGCSYPKNWVRVGRLPSTTSVYAFLYVHMYRHTHDYTYIANIISLNNEINYIWTLCKHNVPSSNI